MAEWYMGIDPGSSNSAYAFYSRNEYHVFDFTDTANRRSHILQFQPTFCVLEKVHAFPGQGAVSAANFVGSARKWEGILEALDVAYEPVLPKDWASIIRLNLPYVKDKTKRKKIHKQHKLDTARQRFPLAELHLQKHIDRAEALLMSLAAFNIHKGLYHDK